MRARARARACDTRRFAGENKDYGETRDKESREERIKENESRAADRNTRYEERSRGKGACNWTAKGTSPSLAARPARYGMVGRGAARRDAAAALRAARHDTMRGRRTRRDTTMTRVATV